MPPIIRPQLINYVWDKRFQFIYIEVAKYTHARSILKVSSEIYVVVMGATRDDLSENWAAHTPSQHLRPPQGRPPTVT